MNPKTENSFVKAKVTKKDNDFLFDKIAIREEACLKIPKKKIRVLDCFGGRGILWKAVKSKLAKKKYIEVVSIDRKAEDGVSFVSDNREVLENEDLKGYDIVDLDSYGVPYAQMKILSEKEFMGIVVGTLILKVVGQLPKALCIELGFTEKTFRTVPILCSKRGWEKWLRWLWENDWRRIIHRSSKTRKHYFMCSKEW
jgi:hypothetical protein